MREIIAKDLMTQDVLAVSENLSVDEAAAFLVDNEITGAAVENLRGQLVGVLSVVDIARETADSLGSGQTSDPGFFGRLLASGLAREELDGLHLDDEGLRVRDIMTSEVFTVAEDAPVADVARTMIEAHIHRVLVSREGRVVGLISTSDLLGLLVGE